MTKTMATVSYHVNYGTDELGVRRTKELTKDFETYQEDELEQVQGRNAHEHLFDVRSHEWQ